MVDDNRTLWKYILFSVLTGGIYSLYFIHKLAKDVNLICGGDGEQTAGAVEYVVFGIFTFGIYDLVWLYKLANRLKANDERYHVRLSEDGATVIKWAIFGLLLFGIGPFAALYIIIKNTNILAERYLSENADHVEQIVKSGDNYIWLAVVAACVAVAVVLYISYFYAWIPQGRNLSACVGKKIGLVMFMHPVQKEDDSIYSIGDYLLSVDPDNNIVTTIGQRDGKKKTAEKYNIRGIYYNQSRKKAKEILKNKFISLGRMGYIFRSNSNYYFYVQFDDGKVSQLSLMYWKQDEREKQWMEAAKSADADENYGDAFMYYRAIRSFDVTQEMEESRYHYGEKLFEEGAYLDAEKQLEKVTLDSYQTKKEEYLQKIDEVKKIFNLDKDDADVLNAWYGEDKTTPLVRLVFDEDGLETYMGSEKVYVVQSWKEDDAIYLGYQESHYLLQLRRLSDDQIVNVRLSTDGVNSRLTFL